MRGREDQADWAVTEFAAAELGDARRTRRLVDLATTLAEQPSASLPDACADPARLKAAYRFYDNAACTPAAILDSQVQAPYHRLRQLPLVLAVNDTSLLDYTQHPATTGLGPLTTVHQQGLLMHTTIAVTPDRVPLGLLGRAIWERDAATFGKQPDQHDRPIEEKESRKWLDRLALVNTAAAACPAPRFVQVGDAEADVYDLFLAERAATVEVLARAGQDRRVETDERSLWQALRQAPVASQVALVLPRQATRPACRVTLALRWRAVTVRPPRKRATEHLPPVPLWAVLATELDPPAGETPIEWLLLTTVPSTGAAEAEERLGWYTCRWGIEGWHKLLKSGCQIEARHLATGERLERGIAVYSVIAWRVQWAVMLARTVPDLPCTALLEREEWEALWCAIHRDPPPPVAVPSVGEAVRWLGRLGGHLGRKRDGAPGVTVLWKGFQHLADLTTMYPIMKPAPPNTRSRLVGKG
jgi:hypothetical protein